MKKCNKCEQIKQLTEFYKNKNSTDGLLHRCKPCQKKVMAKHRSTDEQWLYRINYNKKRKEYISEYNRERQKERRKSETVKIAEKMRQRVIRALSPKNKNPDRFIKTIGCTCQFLKTYLESKFKEGMSWENREKWHIDHIIPIASFDLTYPEQQKKCFHYSNLQTLWAVENILKSNKIIAKNDWQRTEGYTPIQRVNTARISR